jgi:hypothetical protein
MSTRTEWLLKVARDLGRMRALDEAGLSKTANVFESLFDTGTRWALPLGLPAVAGAALAGEGHRQEGAVGGLLGGMAGRQLFKGQATRILGSAPVRKLMARAGGDAATARHILSGRDPKFLTPLLQETGETAQSLEAALTNAENQSIWATRGIGGVAGGLGAKALTGGFEGSGSSGRRASPNISSGMTPANYDIGGHYTGLEPEQDAYDYGLL